MKKAVIILTMLLGTNFVHSQIKLHSNGNVSIGTTTAPSTNNTIYLYGPRLTFGGYQSRFFKFDCSPSDPRWWSSTNEIVFYNTENRVFCDLQAKSYKVASDERYKTDINELDNALNKIINISGVSFYWKNESGLKSTTESTPTNGFIAQDVEKVIPNVVFSDSTGYKTMDYLGLLPYLVESIKELNQKVETQEEYIEQLEVNGSVSTSSLKSLISQQNLSKLYSNQPNPFNNKSTIKYFVPENSSSAKITFYDLNGKQLLAKNLNNYGNGEIAISAEELGVGMFLYSLIVENVLIDTKKMIITD